jgi:hypothetical protein
MDCMKDYTFFTGSGKIHRTTIVNITNCDKVAILDIEEFAKKEILRKVQDLARNMSEKEALDINTSGTWNIPLSSLVSETLASVENGALVAETSNRVATSNKFTDEEKAQYDALMKKFMA